MKKVIYKNETGERIDKFLAQEFSDFSRSSIEHLIKQNNILVNNKTIKTSQKLKFGDIISINFLPIKKVEELLPQKIKLDIIFENNDVIVINKPAGLVVHPAAGHANNTLINALLNYFPNISEAVYDKNNQVSRLRPGLVHRLDKDTSGVMIIAKNERAMHSLSRQIRDRTVKKIYIGLCYGWPKQEKGTMRNFLGRHPKNRKLISEVIPEKGKEAITHYEVINHYKFKSEKISLIKFDSKTGRTHQIRVQISKIGSPILGDLFYGNKLSQKISEKLGIKRQLLHAEIFKITLPRDNKPSVFETLPPKDFICVMNKLDSN